MKMKMKRENVMIMINIDIVTPSTPLPPSLPIPSPPKQFIYKAMKIRNIEEDEIGQITLTMKTVLHRDTIFPQDLRCLVVC